MLTINATFDPNVTVPVTRSAIASVEKTRVRLHVSV